MSYPTSDHGTNQAGQIRNVNDLTAGFNILARTNTIYKYDFERRAKSVQAVITYNMNTAHQFMLHHFLHSLPPPDLRTLARYARCSSRHEGKSQVCRHHSFRQRRPTPHQVHLAFLRRQLHHSEKRDLSRSVKFLLLGDRPGRRKKHCRLAGTSARTHGAIPSQKTVCAGALKPCPVSLERSSGTAPLIRDQEKN